MDVGAVWSAPVVSPVKEQGRREGEKAATARRPDAIDLSDSDESDGGDAE